MRNITKRFGNKQILSNLSMKIYYGEKFVIIGPGGSGKSTLLKIIGGIIKPDEGELYFYKENGDKYKENELSKLSTISGFLFQNYALFDSLTIEENIGFYLKYHTDFTSEKRTEKVRDALNKVQLKNVETLKPVSLSGGMKRRVGIARAIIHEPKIIFLDEPTAGLDPVTGDKINNLILDFQQKLNATTITVTSQIQTAMSIGDRIALLYDKSIVSIVDKNKFLTSQEPHFKQFVEGTKVGPIKND